VGGGHKLSYFSTVSAKIGVTRMGGFFTFGANSQNFTYLLRSTKFVPFFVMKYHYFDK
jgi:hypothetical protein